MIHRISEKCISSCVSTDFSLGLSILITVIAKDINKIMILAEFVLGLSTRVFTFEEYLLFS